MRFWLPEPPCSALLSFHSFLIWTSLHSWHCSDLICSSVVFRKRHQQTVLFPVLCSSILHSLFNLTSLALPAVNVERLLISSPSCPPDEAAAILCAHTGRGEGGRWFPQEVSMSSFDFSHDTSRVHLSSWHRRKTSIPLLIVQIWLLQDCLPPTEGRWILSQHIKCVVRKHTPYIRMNHMCKQLTVTTSTTRYADWWWLNLCTHITSWRNYKGKRPLITNANICKHPCRWCVYSQCAPNSPKPLILYWDTPWSHTHGSAAAHSKE